MKIGSIPSSWMSITGAWSAEVNLNLLEEVNKRGIDHKDLTAVRAVWDEIRQQAENSIEASILESRKRAADAKESRAKITEISDKFPALRGKIRSSKIK
jgi:hypothetical protein